MNYRSYAGSYKEMDQPYTDGWKKTSYSKYVPQPSIVDAEGREMPIIRHSTGHNGESYLVQTERVIRHIAPAPVVRSLVTEYRYSSDSGKEEVFRDYGVDKEYARVTSTYDRPAKVEEFLTKVLDEASRPIKAALPLTSAWRGDPKSPIRTSSQDGMNKYVDDQDFKGSDRKKLNGNATWSKQNEQPFLQGYKGTNPMINRNKDVHDFYDRPRGNEGSYVPSRPLSKPTNNIDNAMEFLTEGIKPEYGNDKKEEFTSNVQNDQAPKVVPLSTNRWRANLAGKDRKMESSEYDSEKQNQHARRSKADDRDFENNRAAAKELGNTDGYEKAKLPSQQKKEINSYLETIDSREASRRYGKTLSRPKTEEEFEGTINSKEAVEKYKGALVPW